MSLSILKILKSIIFNLSTKNIKFFTESFLFLGSFFFAQGVFFFAQGSFFLHRGSLFLHRGHFFFAQHCTSLWNSERNTCESSSSLALVFYFLQINESKNFGNIWKLYFVWKVNENESFFIFISEKKFMLCIILIIEAHLIIIKFPCMDLIIKEIIFNIYFKFI